MDKQNIIDYLLETDREKIHSLFDMAYNVKTENIGDKVYLRGLIEVSNICIKNCNYCGLRRDNRAIVRYELSEKEILDAAMFAYVSGYGSVVLQAGERSTISFTKKITTLLRSIKDISEGKLGITLSLGEQPNEVYQEWFENGAHRYLLRIESSNPDIYRRIHPNDSNHSYDRRLESIMDLMRIGYQTGTGVMFGIPGTSFEDMADDLIFIRRMGVHMVGMGPYLVHSQTPMGRDQLSMRDRVTGYISPDITLCLKMIALLRIIAPKINIAASTALQVLDLYGREKAIKCGANIIMPNITTAEVRENYQIYENKPGIRDDAAISKTKLEDNLNSMGLKIGWSEWGDSKAYDIR